MAPGKSTWAVPGRQGPGTKKTGSTMSLRRMTMLCLALSLITAPIAFAEVLVGSTSADYQWDKASGNVEFYEVHVSRDGGQPTIEQLAPASDTPVATIQGEVGEILQIAVAAGNSLGARGPLSPQSEPLRFVARPSVPDLLTPGVFQSRPLASVVGDLFYDEPETGDVWIVEGDDPTAEPQFIDHEPDPAWEVVVTGDFDADDVADLFWRNQNDGATRIWFMNGTLYQELSTGTDPGADWRPEAAGDFDGNSQDDVFWRSDSGQTLAWLLDGASFVEESFPPITAAGWELLTVGDFDADGQDEFFWHDTHRAKTALWFRETNSLGEPYIRFEYSEPLAGGWQAIEIADDNGDGRDDVHLRLELPAETLYQWWWMNGAEVIVDGDDEPPPEYEPPIIDPIIPF